MATTKIFNETANRQLITNLQNENDLHRLIVTVGCKDTLIALIDEYSILSVRRVLDGLNSESPKRRE